ncbi:MAG TPA: hypothetical protein VEK79_06380 [Thermoanaerobaculia bacterium]|nr:hypothetical protein [Thermoanaerobaculia bacterium]
MHSRRSLLARFAAGAGALLLPRSLFARPATDLIAPFGIGDTLPLGWSIASMSPLVKSASTLTLQHVDGRSAQVSVRRRGANAIGLAQTAKLDLVLLNGGAGVARTDEDLGRVILGLAAVVREHEHAG